MKDEPTPTQKRIAEILGISQTLVSRALSGRAGEIGASPETVERILRTARELNYVPSANALALRGAPTRTLGVVVKDFDDPYFGRIIGALQTLARESDYSLLLTGGEERDISALQKHRVDGVILAGSDFNPPGLVRSVFGDIRGVQIGCGKRPAGFFQVSLDERNGIRGLVKHLVDFGHRRVGFVGQKHLSARRRGVAFKEALTELLPDEADRASPGSVQVTSRDEIGPVAERLLRSKRRPTALVFADDALALAFLREFHARGVSIPSGLSVAGIDDIPASEDSVPPLTTLQQPFRELADQAFRILTGEQPGEGEIQIPGRIVPRLSTAAPPVA